MTDLVEIQQVVNQVANGNWKALASDLGCTPEYLRNGINPNQYKRENSSFAIRFDFLVGVLDRCVDQSAFIQWICGRYGFTPIRSKPVSNSGNLTCEFTKVVTELGDVAQALNEAMADGTIDRFEKEKLKKETLELVVAVQALSGQISSIKV